MRFMQLLRILRAHAGLIFLCLMLAWVAAGVLTVAMTERYVATSSVLVDFADNSSVTQKPPVQLYSSYLATQLDLLASQTVALKVVQKLQLENNPDARTRFLGAESSMQSMLSRVKASLQSLVARISRKKPAANVASDVDERYRLADQVLRHTSIRPSPDSSVLQVSYAASSAQAAAEAANAIVEAYIQTTLEMNVNPARASSEWLDQQVERLSAEAQAARSALADFQQRTGIVSTDANDAESVRLNDLNSQLVAAQSQNHPAIQALKSDLARAQAKLNELPPQLGPNHPSYQRTVNEVNELRAQLESESARIASNLREEIARQRGSMLTMRRQHGQLAALQDAVDSAQRMLDDAVQKATQARMNSQVTQTNVSIIRVAVPPRQPTSPNAAFNFALASVLGLVLGVGVGLWREVVCRFVRSADDIRDFLGVQVLGVLHGGPRSSSGRVRLLSSREPMLLGER
jgi:succinoglycan biosynthesis transport protein ExoP